MTLEYRKHITRDQLQAEPDTLFVFGDNMQRVGLGGQAAEMRGEPNAVGIPTKYRDARSKLRAAAEVYPYFHWVEAIMPSRAVPHWSIEVVKP